MKTKAEYIDEALDLYRKLNHHQKVMILMELLANDAEILLGNDRGTFRLNWFDIDGDYDLDKQIGVKCQVGDADALGEGLRLSISKQRQKPEPKTP